MDDKKVRLARCFTAVFPDLQPTEAENATTDTVKEWDSLASVTLFSLIEEEFGVSLDMDALDDFSSFQRILTRIDKS